MCDVVAAAFARSLARLAHSEPRLDVGGAARSKKIASRASSTSLAQILPLGKRVSLLSHIARHNCTSMSVFAVTQAAAADREASKSLASVVLSTRKSQAIRDHNIGILAMRHTKRQHDTSASRQRSLIMQYCGQVMTGRLTPAPAAPSTNCEPANVDAPKLMVRP